MTKLKPDEIRAEHIQSVAILGGILLKIKLVERCTSPEAADFLAQAKISISEAIREQREYIGEAHLQE